MFHLWCVSICVYTPISYNIKNINIKILLGFGFSLRNSASMASLCMASQALCRVCGGVWHLDIGSRSPGCSGLWGGDSMGQTCLSGESNGYWIRLASGKFVGCTLGPVHGRLWWTECSGAFLLCPSLICAVLVFLWNWARALGD